MGKQKSGKVSDANKKQLREDLFCGQSNVDIPSSRKRKGMVPLVISSQFKSPHFSWYGWALVPIERAAYTSGNATSVIYKQVL